MRSERRRDRTSRSRDISSAPRRTTLQPRPQDSRLAVLGPSPAYQWDSCSLSLRDNNSHSVYKVKLFPEINGESERKSKTAPAGLPAKAVIVRKIRSRSTDRTARRAKDPEPAPEFPLP